MRGRCWLEENTPPFVSVALVEKLEQLPTQVLRQNQLQRQLPSLHQDVALLLVVSPIGVV